MLQIAATHRGDTSLRRCDKSPRLHSCCDKAVCAHFVAAICRTNSNQFEFVRQIAATKSNVGKKMADVHFTTMPYEPSAACKAQRKPKFYNICPCTKDIEQV